MCTHWGACQCCAYTSVCPCLHECVPIRAIPPSQGIQKHLFWPMLCSGMGGWGAGPEHTRCFLALCSSKTPILGIQKHFFWPMVVQWYGWLGRHSRTHTIFSGILQFKDTHPRDPKHISWPMVCSGMGGWGATPVVKFPLVK